MCFQSIAWLLCKINIMPQLVHLVSKSLLALSKAQCFLGTNIMLLFCFILSCDNFSCRLNTLTHNRVRFFSALRFSFFPALPGFNTIKWYWQRKIRDVEETFLIHPVHLAGSTLRGQSLLTASSATPGSHLQAQLPHPVQESAWK